jgi:hypothetical protein
MTTIVVIKETMPTATAPTRKRGRPAKTHVDDIDRELENLTEEIPASAGEFLGFNPFDESVPFLDVIRMIPDAEWSDRYLMYLYRLDPKIRNAEGEPAFIDKYKESVDEEDVKRKHGGGKYMLILKDDVLQKRDPSLPKPRERRYRFRIDGEPLYIAGQKLMDPSGHPIASPPPAPSNEGHADLAAVLREVLNGIREASKGNEPELVRKSYDMALDVVRDAAKREGASMTGNPMMDTLFVKMFERSLDPHDKGMERLLAKLESSLERLANPQPPAGGDVIGQLGGLQKLLGVDSILDLIRPDAGDGAWKGKLVELAGGVVQTLPQLIQAFAMNQERQFQRAKEVEALRLRNAAIANGEVPPTIPPIVSAGAVPPNPAQPGPVLVEEPQQPQLNVVGMLVADVAILFEQGSPGDLAAGFVDRKYADSLGLFRNLLVDLEQVRQFCKNTQGLAELATDPDTKDDFDQFLQDFVAELNQPAETSPPAS